MPQMIVNTYSTLSKNLFYSIFMKEAHVHFRSLSY